MPDTVAVTIEVEPGAAAAMADARTRAAIGRLVSRVLRPGPGQGPGPGPGPSELAQAIAGAKAAARAEGLTDADVDAELAAYNGERRGNPAA